jgi:hypothetical protein
MFCWQEAVNFVFINRDKLLMYNDFTIITINEQKNQRQIYSQQADQIPIKRHLFTPSNAAIWQFHCHMMLKW